jgi:pyochelin biosynthesis protein PchC
VLDHPDLLELALPAIRADYRMVETYPRRPPQVVRTPIVGYAADGGPEVNVADVRAWAEVTTAGFEWRVFAGDHFYLVPAEAEVVGDVAARLGPAPTRP